MIGCKFVKIMMIILKVFPGGFKALWNHSILTMITSKSLEMKKRAVWPSCRRYRLLTYTVKISNCSNETIRLFFLFSKAIRVFSEVAQFVL